MAAQRSAPSAGPSPVAGAWRINPAAVLHWRLIDAEWVLYEDRSGRTHLLDLLSAAALMVFEGGGVQDLPGLQRELQADLGTADLPQPLLATVVQQLCQFDLLLRADLPTHATA